MKKLQLLSSGFFKEGKHKVGIDYNEEAMFDEIENDNTFNVMVDNYNFNINDLAVLKVANGKNFLNEHIITDEEYMYFAENHYIEYCKANDMLKVIITIYDFDNCIDKDLLKFLEKFGRTIEIIINTEEERNIIFKQLNDYFKYYGYEDIEDFLEKEYEN